MPTEIRTRPSVIPSLSRVSTGTDACVIVAGCEMSDSTPPRLSPKVHSFTPSKTFLAFSSEPVSNDTMPPKPVWCLFANSCYGCEARPG